MVSGFEGIVFVLKTGSSGLGSLRRLGSVALKFGA